MILIKLSIFSCQKIGLVFEILLAVLRAMGVVTGILLHNFGIAIIGYAIGSMVAILAQYVWLMWLVKKYDQSLSSDREESFLLAQSDNANAK